MFFFAVSRPFLNRGSVLSQSRAGRRHGTAVLRPRRAAGAARQQGHAELPSEVRVWRTAGVSVRDAPQTVSPEVADDTLFFHVCFRRFSSV